MHARYVGCFDVAALEHVALQIVDEFDLAACDISCKSSNFFSLE